MPALVVELLGGFAARRNDRSIPIFESDKTRGFAGLPGNGGGKAHRRETLAGLLWPEMPEQRARANLNQAVYSLRRTLEVAGCAATAAQQPPHAGTKSRFWPDHRCGCLRGGAGVVPPPYPQRPIPLRHLSC